jgi:hypothetical protein
MVLAVANYSIQGFSDSSLCWMERNRLRWSDNTIPCLSLVYRVEVFVLVEVRAVGPELQPAVVERRSRVAPGCCCARMSAACGNVRAVVATSALANLPLL